MAYEPTNWKTGDVVTSAKLNKLENGVAESAGFLKVTTSYNASTKVTVMDKTWQEIYDVLANGGYVCCVELNLEQPRAEQAQIVLAVHSTVDGDKYLVTVAPLEGMSHSYYCDTSNDYPYLDHSDDVS